MAAFWLMPAVWWVLGAWYFVWGLGAIVEARLFYARALRTEGRITAVRTRSWTTTSTNSLRRTIRTRTEHLPEVAFSVEGLAYEAVASAGSRLPLWSPGDLLDVAYLARDPSRARLVGWVFAYDRPARRLGWATFYGAIGVVAWLSLLGAGAL